MRPTSSGTESGSVARTTNLATSSGVGELSRHLAASLYVSPTLASLAVSAAISNSGWGSSSWISRCPTAPVAPSTPTRTVIA